VVVEGSDDFSDPAAWSFVSGGTWLSASVTWKPKQVFVDGQRLTASSGDPALLPEGGFIHVSGQGLYVHIGGDNPGLHETFVGRRNNGFRVNARSWISIEGFHVTRCEDVGIYALSGSADIRIAGNMSSLNAATGISVVGTARAAVVGNIASDNARHGIYLLNGTTQSLVEGNEAMRNAREDGDGINGIKIETSSGNLVQRNRTHDNQDTGLQINLSHDTIARLNASWNNGDHGFDHLASLRAVHISSLAYGNHHDGFSFEGGSTDGALHNSIAVNNGLGTAGNNLFVDAPSAAGFISDYNVIWNETALAPVRFNGVIHPSLASFTAATGQEVHGLEMDPLFEDAAAGEFTPQSGSPAVDSAATQMPSWPETDLDGRVRVDDPSTGNSGSGSVAYADRGPLEFHGNCNAGAGPGIEACDSADNDCDGVVDNGYPVGQICAVGIGACQAYGLTSCSLDGLGTFCNASPGIPEPEVCDGADNNCDGLADNAPPPGQAPLMEAAPAGAFEWPSVAEAGFYQVVRGSLGLLASSAGDFTSATGQCLASAMEGTAFDDTQALEPGQGFWYLVRAGNCGGMGSYDTGAASQSGQRDAEIGASPQGCP
jgi:parallel beta-helix repeat protein